MAGKAGFKDILLKKGEKIALGVCGFFCLLLLYTGLAGGPAKSTKQLISELEQATNSVRNGLKNESTDSVKSLPPWLSQTGALEPVPSDKFLVSAIPFEPINWPSLRRENPKVFTPIESQIDTVSIAVVRKDRRFQLNPKTGEEELKQVGVIRNQTIKNEDVKSLKERYEKSTKPVKPTRKGQNPGTPNGGTGVGTGPGGTKGGGLAGGPPGGFPGGMPGSGRGFPGGMPGSGRGMPGGIEGPANFGGGSTSEGSRTEQIVDYVTPEEMLKNKYREAETIQPTRLAVIQAVFPLKLQLQEIQRAMRLQTLAEAIQASAPPGGSTATGLPGGGGKVPGSGSGPMIGEGTLPGRGTGPTTGPGNLPGATGASNATLYTLSPEFLRMEVERKRVGYDGKPYQVTGKDGKLEDAPWEPFDHQGVFFDYFVRYETLMYEETPKKISYIDRIEEKEGNRTVYRDVSGVYELDPQMYMRPGQGITAPLPRVAENLALDYPPKINLWYIHDNARRLSKLLENPQVKDQFRKQLERKNNSNPYSLGSEIGTQGGNGPGTDDFRGGGTFTPPGFGNSSGSFPGMPGGPSFPGGKGPGGKAPGMGLPGMGLPGMGLPGGSGSTGQLQNVAALNDPNAIGAEYVLLRFLDPTIQPGESYKYRIRLVMKNPNYQKREQMANETDADKLELENPSEWYECPQTASLAPEFYMFAGNVKKYEADHKQILDPNDPAQKKDAPKAYQEYCEVKDVAAGKKAVVQIQWWLPQLILPGSTSQEPIGAWVTADVPVGPGEFIGRKTLVPLPLWSSKSEGYVMASRKLQKAGIASLKPADTPPGQIVNFTTPNLLIDYEGRKGEARKTSGSSKDKDETEIASELLMLRPDGTIEILSELQAAADKDRVKRQDLWSKWVEEVTKRKEQGVDKPGGTGSGGDRGGGDR